MSTRGNSALASITAGAALSIFTAARAAGPENSASTASRGVSSWLRNTVEPAGLTAPTWSAVTARFAPDHHDHVLADGRDADLGLAGRSLRKAGDGRDIDAPSFEVRDQPVTGLVPAHCADQG